MKRVLLATACSLIGIGAGAQQKEPLQFSGICDASAAIALDENRIIVGDDEKPWLSIYRLDTLTPEGPSHCRSARAR